MILLVGLPQMIWRRHKIWLLLYYNALLPLLILLLRCRYHSCLSPWLSSMHMYYHFLWCSVFSILDDCVMPSSPLQCCSWHGRSSQPKTPQSQISVVGLDPMAAAQFFFVDPETDSWEPWGRDSCGWPVFTSECRGSNAQWYVSQGKSWVFLGANSADTYSKSGPLACDISRLQRIYIHINE